MVDSACHLPTICTLIGKPSLLVPKRSATLVASSSGMRPWKIGEPRWVATPAVSIESLAVIDRGDTVQVNVHDLYRRDLLPADRFCGLGCVSMDVFVFHGIPGQLGKNI
jgi:hypothetical protein